MTDLASNQAKLALKYEGEATSRLIERRPMSTIAALGYGSGTLATATFIVAPQLLLLFYMTELLDIPAGWAGAALLLPKAWEMVLDPWLGWQSDRTTTRLGRRRPFMIAGVLLFPAAFALLFAAPDLHGWPARLAFVIAAYFAATTACSLFAVPYVALLPDLADNPQARTRLVAYRMAFLAVGILLAGAVAPALVEHWGSDRRAYAMLGVTLAGLGTLAMMSAVAATVGVRVEAGVRGEGFRAGLRAVGRARPFRSLSAVYLLQMASNGANAAMLVYAARFLFEGGEAIVGLVFGLFTLASLVATPVFAHLGRRWGKRRGLVRSTVAYAAAMLLFMGAVVFGDDFLFAAAIVSGVANAGTQLFAFSLLPDVVERDRIETGVAREGLFTGVWSAGEKLGLASGAALAGIALQAAGYVEGATATQSAQALAAIAIMLSVVPAILMAASLLFLPPDIATEVQNA